MLFPFDTDVPSSHRPILTLVLIAANVIVFVLLWNDAFDPVEFTLQHGDGLHPLQWVTSSFIHGSLGHVIGNMIFLWVFGIVVEGHAGPLIFLAIYFGIGVVQNTIEQLIFSASEPTISFGASSIIYGLIAIAVVWAPLSNTRVFYWIFFRAGVFEAKIRTVGLCYIGLDVVLALLESPGETVSSSLLHVMGAVVGLPIGLLLVKRGWVDCDDADWFSVRAGKHTGEVLFRPAASGLPPAPSAVDRSLELDMLRDNLAAGDAASALEVYRGAQSDGGGWQLDEADLRKLTEGLYRVKSWNAFTTLAREHRQRFSGQGHTVGLLLAADLIRRRERPTAGLRMLSTLPTGCLGAKGEELRARLIREAESLKARGVLELEDPD